jgi:hypothetical protein
MKHLARSLSVFLVIVAAPVAMTACSSDDDSSTRTTDVVVVAAPLSMGGPALVATADGDVIVGTIENVTDRIIEITSAQTSAGAAEFHSADGSLLASIKVEPQSAVDLAVGGVTLALLEPTDDDSVDVVLGLDIQDDFTFAAERSVGE